MKTVSWLCVCFLLAAVSLAIASARIGQRPVGICTNDINVWGNSSSCTCNEGNYDERSGLCLVGNGAESVRVQGKVTAGVMAIGGETTGYIISTPEGETYELILKMDDRQKLDRLSGLWFEIEGELVVIQSPELAERKAIIVEKIAHLE